MSPIVPPFAAMIIAARYNAWPLARPTRWGGVAGSRQSGEASRIPRRSQSSQEQAAPGRAAAHQPAQRRANRIRRHEHRERLDQRLVPIRRSMIPRL